MLIHEVEVIMEVEMMKKEAIARSLRALLTQSLNLRVTNDGPKISPLPFLLTFLALSTPWAAKN